jgi:hypothetical protein
MDKAREHLLNYELLTALASVIDACASYTDD